MIRLEAKRPQVLLKVGMANELMNRFAELVCANFKSWVYEVDMVAIISYAQLESIQAQHLISILDLSAKTTMIHQPESMVVRIPQSETISSRGLSLHEVMKYYEFVLQIFYSTNNLQITLLSVNANSPPHHQSPTGKSQDLHPRPGATLSWEKCIQGRKCSCVRDVVHIKNKTIRNQWSLKCRYYTVSNLRQVNHGFRFFLLGHAWWKSSAGLLDELDLVSEVPFQTVAFDLTVTLKIALLHSD